MDPCFTYTFVVPLPFAPYQGLPNVDELNAPPPENDHFPVCQWTGMAGWDAGSDTLNSLNDFALSAPSASDAPYPSPFYPHLSSCTSTEGPFYASSSSFSSTEAFDAAYGGCCASSTQGLSVPDALFSSQEARDAFFYELDALRGVHIDFRT